ncbi:prenyltransferase/squalene oxidase repeat-containing protein [Paraburkholderia atlantica]|uniref:Squalene cyclase C-terminal domain-containing protein n=1 Tax=Paraburkholderia atlantica TaxID=2654982 RepID=A0A7W8QFL3_PARAM|nr:prenyltransferase/squalene oxidase repeat-containing protein [Paraburkholderia atlantica]MBB5421618.1 hypothetical protein [Paraburkholderia atlantica]MBB5429380.1 hypothetical protein [Paraburkholderia atlantica]
MLQSLPEQILSELRHLLGGMSDGGSVGPSIYDTALNLHFQADSSEQREAYRWLLAQQHADGGWGSPDFPLFRHAPTLAASLALHRADQFPERADAVRAAQAFLLRQPDPYLHAVPEEAPIGVELILPQLCDEAGSLLAELVMPRHPALRPLRQSRLDRLAATPALPTGHPLLHSWEAWGSSPAEVELDANGSIGISPAATAVWRHRAVEALAAQRVGLADAYLLAAARATQTGIDAVVPNVWPIDVFEPCWVLYTLHLAGLFSHPALADEVSKGIARLERCMSARGLGPASHFAADADDTAMALCVLSLAGREPSAEPLRQFESGDLFVTFPGERNASVSTNIHALHAMRKLGRPAPGAGAFVEANRTARGIWESDKWHVSWLYPTSHAVAALAHASPQWRDERALVALLDAQHKDGGWGSGRSCTFEETAYALFALRVSSDREDQAGRQRISQAVARALDWMLAGYAPRSVPQTPLWIGKELYCPLRVVRVAELAGLWLAHGWARHARTDDPGEAR